MTVSQTFIRWSVRWFSCCHNAGYIIAKKFLIGKKISVANPLTLRSITKYDNCYYNSRQLGLLQITIAWLLQLASHIWLEVAFTFHSFCIWKNYWIFISDNTFFLPGKCSLSVSVQRNSYSYSFLFFLKIFSAMFAISSMPHQHELNTFNWTRF